MLHRLRVPSDQTFRPARLSLFSVTSRDTPRYIWYVVRKEEHGDFFPFRLLRPRGQDNKSHGIKRKKDERHARRESHKHCGSASARCIKR